MARRTLEIIDSHTGGEPTRVVVSGLPDLGNGSLAEQRDCLLNRHARWLGGIVGEPRSSEVVVGAILTAPVSPGATAGVIFFNNVGALGMCGHGSIGLIETLAFLGRIGPGEHRIDTPVGSVTCRLHEDGRVSVRNVPSYRFARDVAVALADGQSVRGDIAWGGNWFFLAGDAPVPVEFANIGALSRHAAAIRAGLEQHGIRGAEGALIDHIELFGVTPTADSRNFVLCPGAEYDRSPCGTGTSAKLACLAADGKLAPGQTWRQESICASVFEGRFDWADAEHRAIIPTITGRAHITGHGQLVFDDDDPFCWGIS